MKQFLGDHEIGTGVYYPGPLHLEEAYSYLGYKPGDMPEAELACKEVLSIPVYPEMTEEQLEFVVKTVKAFFV